MEFVRSILKGKISGTLVELVFVTLIPFVVIVAGWRLVGENALARQGVVWIANVLILLTIWTGLRLRGQTWKHLGLSFDFPGWRGLIGNLLRAAGVLVFALAAFILASIPMVNLGYSPPKADLTSYDWLRGDFTMLVFALAAVYIVSSFGEEVIYRGFLITRLAELGDNSKSAIRAAAVSSAVVFGLIHFTWGVMGIVQTTSSPNEETI